MEYEIGGYDHPAPVVDVTPAPLLVLSVWVPGHPRTKGSLDAQVAPGRTRTGAQRVRVTDTQRSKTWRRTVAVAMRTAAQERHVATLDGPLMVRLTFYTPWPAVHAWAGDLDKLQRNVFDALKDARVITDDKLIVRAEASKIYAEGTAWGPGVAVELWQP